jgi:hypothetical protein
LKAFEQKPVTGTKARKIETPGFIWFLYSIGLATVVAVSIAWPIVSFKTHDTVQSMMVPWLIVLGALAGTIKEFVKQIKLTKLEIGEEGLWRRIKTGRVLVKWEEIVRYNDGKSSFTLYLKNGKRINIPANIKDFEELQKYFVQKLEQTGSSERMVPGVPYPVSFGEALGAWLIALAAIALLIMFIVGLIKQIP